MPKTVSVPHAEPFSGSIVSGREKKRITLIFGVVFGLYLWTSVETESTVTDLIAGLPHIWNMVGQLFPPNWDYVSQVWPKLLETIQMAVIATTIAAILCIPFCLLAARNVTSIPWIHHPAKLFLNALRTIPDLILAVVFVGIFGIGVFSGILALIIFSFGILTKLISETIESIDPQPLEAIRASGGNAFQIIAYAVVPQVLPQFCSFSLYVFEINVRASVVLGFVGAGGIGLLLQQQIAFLRYPNVMTLILIIFFVVLAIEYISGKIRERLV
ncbi:phosphonate ABC transporter, permease protein PhnE [Desmospora profundinema]|uniref:Phosphonate transport system permease protein n=1 Tax=Desmospora profundinema TaxID=1571184 RepID=A0ABU1ILZ6_9BACL|nr:phosphonate ABC transporter, permease protein PhnE [Desmospora profundinema]MDR6225795.1 phosphonate transport system permease protein [Desmospora profundinema]